MLRNSLYVAVLLLLTGCPEEIPEDDMEVIIENQTIEKVVIWASLSESEENPDTTLPIDFPWGDIENIYEERIRDEYIVAKRVDFDTWEDLELVEFTVTYP